MSVIGHSSGIVAHSAATALPFPPLSGAYVWNKWNYVREFDLEILPASASTLSLAELFACKQISSAIASDDFTVVHGTEVVTASSHGLDTGDGPFTVSNSGGALPAGLTAGTNYWFIKIDGDTGHFAASLADAFAGTKVFMTSNGTGTHSLVGASALRSRWFSMGLLGPAADGTIAMSSDEGYMVRVLHHPQAIAYAVAATVGGSVATTVKVSHVIAGV